MHRIKIPDYAIAKVLKRRGHLQLFGELDPRSCALIVIDMQNTFVAEGAPLEVPIAKEIVPTINRLAATTRLSGGRVVWIKMTRVESDDSWSVWHTYFLRPEKQTVLQDALARGGEGHEIYSGLDVDPADLIIEKCRFSAFIQGSSELDDVLHEHGIDTVVIVGTQTNVCCEASARDAMMLNYKVVFVSDANAAATDEEHNSALANIMQNYGEVISTDEVIQRLEPEGARMET